MEHNIVTGVGIRTSLGSGGVDHCSAMTGTFWWKGDLMLCMGNPPPAPAKKHETNSQGFLFEISEVSYTVLLFSSFFLFFDMDLFFFFCHLIFFNLQLFAIQNWTIFLKSLLNLLQYCFCLYFGFLASRHVGSYFRNLGSSPHPLLCKAKYQPLALPGKSP